MVIGSLAIAAVGASPAAAATGHLYSSQFGVPGSGPGQFSGPAGVSIEQSSGDVYVVDEFNNRVERFDPTGTFLSSFDGTATPAGAFFFPTSVAVDQSTGDVYVTDEFNNAVDKFGPTGTYLSQLDPAATPATAFSSPSGVAVDPVSHDVYVADSGNNVVDIFSQAGTYLSQFDGSSSGTAFSSPGSIAIDGNSNVYVVDSGNAHVDEFTALGAAFTRVVDSNSPTVVATDQTTNHAYVGGTGAAGFQVSDHDATGALVYTFGAGRLGGSTGIAVNSSSDKVYVADNANSAVFVYTPFVAPDVSTGAATDLTSDSATANGTVNPLGIETTYHFNYGTDTTYANGATPDGDAGSGTGDVPATGAMTGLAPNTLYHYQLVATNASGSNAGADQTFTTAPAAPTVDGQPASATAVTATTATLNGTVNPNNSDTSYSFDYGTTTDYGTSAPSPAGDAGAGSSDTPVTTTLTGLQPSTTYHFRVVADNGTGGAIQGADQTFTTLPPLPAASTGGASGVTTTSATLAGTVNGNGLDGTYRFYVTGLDTVAGGATDAQPLAGASGQTNVSGTITGLLPGHSYGYRVAITTVAGTAYGEQQTFATGPDNQVPVVIPPPLNTDPAAAYGCVAPHLNAYTAGVKPGQNISLRGSDLGVAGTVSVGSSSGDVTGYSATRVDVTIPKTATGTVSLQVDCGKKTNAITVKIVTPPSNTVSLKAKTSATAATLTVGVPGAGTLRASGKDLAGVSKRATKKSTVTIRLALTKAGKAALAKAKSHTLKITVSLRFTPTGGSAKTVTKAVTFRAAVAKKKKKK